MIGSLLVITYLVFVFLMLASLVARPQQLERFSACLLREVLRCFIEIGRGFLGVLSVFADPPRRRRVVSTQRGLVVLPTAINVSMVDMLVQVARDDFLRSWSTLRPIDWDALDTFERRVYEIYEDEWEGRTQGYVGGLPPAPPPRPAPGIERTATPTRGKRCTCNQPGAYCHCGGALTSRLDWTS